MDNKKIHKSDVILKWLDSINYLNDISFEKRLEKLKDIIEILPSNYDKNRYGHDSVCLEGSKDFVFFMLGILSIMYYMEDDENRLEVNMNELALSKVEKPYNKDKKHYVCYVRIVKRKNNYATI